jgi:hypothetical protein
MSGKGCINGPIDKMKWNKMEVVYNGRAEEMKSK